MPELRRNLSWLTALIVLVSATTLADEQVCGQASVNLERRLRQVYLDVIGRPPTLEEYRFIQGKGAILPEDLRELMGREEFYSKIKGYHRALLRANISTSIYSEGETRLVTTGAGLQPLGFRGLSSSPLRGQIGAGCDAFVMQDDCNTSRQDPLLEPTTKTCRDSAGVPMPVSVDYNSNNYDCQLVTGATDCTDAIGKPDATGRVLAAKHQFYCDMRRLADNTLKPHYCLPDAAKPQTAALTTEELDANGKVIAFSNPAPVNGSLPRLARCTLSLNVDNGIKGRYSVQQGCIQREGVVLTAPPYFDVSGVATVPMCAIEAQVRDVNPFTMESCESTRFRGDRSCGCGVNSRRCDQGSGVLFSQRIAAVNEEPLRLIDSVIRRDEDYFTILTTRRSFINGVLSQMYRENQNNTVWLVTPPTSRDATPNVPLTAPGWAEYTRDAQASGVLTTPAWLYRFPTQRSRVNQFYGAFLCKHFSPPSGVDAPPPEDSCNRENNLAKRCGCNYCHATIEPTGAHWGRYGERNAQYLDPAKFPKIDTRCRDCALSGDTTCNNECGNYVMQAYDGDGANSLGELRTYLYRTADEEPNIVGGPKLLVQKMMQTGDLERCAVGNIWNELLGRPMTADEQTLYLKSLTESFTAKNHNLKELILDILSTEAYRRID